MPDTITGTKISALTAASSASDSDVLAGVQSSTTKKFSLGIIKAWIKSWLVKGDVGLSNVANVLQYSADNKPTPSDIGAQAAIKAGSITLSTTWSGSGPYTQTVTVTGVTVTSNSVISLRPTPAQIAALQTDGITALTVENNAGTLTATAIGGSTSAAMTIACDVTEVA